METLKKLVFLAGCLLFLVWFWPNIQMLTGDSEGSIRLILAGFFSLIILFRLKPRTSRSLGGTPGIIAAGILGAVFAVLGLMFKIHQFEWLGIILVLYACLRWSLPDRWSSDIVRSMFVLYWIHPLPGRLLGWFEILMQKLSISGSEWLLHILNVRIWAEGVYLHTGNRIFGVPEACSGMRTAVTMLICVLGVSILFRQRWWETIVFMILGSVQVLILNIVRITFMVFWAQRMPQAWSETFLHDSLGFFLLIAVFLVQAEMSWWKIHVTRLRKRREQIENEEVEEPDQANTLPRIWYLIFKSLKWAIPLIIIILAGLFAGYKRRPYHRAAMISDVVDGLMETNPAAAEAAVNDALSYRPGSRELLKKKAHVLILREKYEEVLQVIDSLSPPLDTFEAVTKSWALMSLGRAEEAMAMVKALPESEQGIPGVAIVKAEYAVMLKDVAGASSNVIIAAGSSFTTRRVRDIYPFLAMHQQWSAITRSNNFAVPYENITSALIVIQAYIKQRDLISASRALEFALDHWPDDPKLLRALYYMAVTEPDSRWAERFARNFVANIKSFSADETAKRMNMAFRLQRPDLGWLAYLRLRSLDPSDPELFLAPARYGSQWFRFKRSQVGIPVAEGRVTIDLGPFINYTGSSLFFREYWKLIPLADELLAPDSSMFQARMLRKGISEFEKRFESGEGSERLQSAYPVALGIAGRFDDAHRYLESMMRKNPERIAEILFQQAELYHSENMWQDSYEYLRRYFDVKDTASLRAYLMMVDNLMRMNMGVYALDVLREAKEHFPGSSEVELARASLWDVFGFEGMAFHLLGEQGRKTAPFMRAGLLLETGRYREAEKAAKVLGVRPPDYRGMKQKLFLPPAELTVQNNWPEPFSKAQLEKRLKNLKRERSKITSPFLSGIVELEEGFLRGEPVSVDAWSKTGRNSRESASALHRLAVLAGRQHKFGLAVNAARRAVEHLPQSPVLWRILIAISKGDRRTVERAQKYCPNDPEVWLASLVSANYAEGEDEMLLVDLRETFAKNVFPVETYIRAADFFIRKQKYPAALLLGEQVEDKANNMLAANMLTLRCALIKKDYEKALSAALKCVRNSLDPGPFYKMTVALKSAGRQADAHLVEALEHLSEENPGDNRWLEDLGMVYFERGDMVRALSVLNTLIKKDIRNVTARSFILAAESARREGDTAKSIDLLRAARRLYPENEMVLNNLVYSMAQDKETLPEATALLPELEKIEDKTFHVYDTIAIVHMNSGSLQKARLYMNKALELVDAAQYSANDTKLNSAELYMKTGNSEAARAIILEIRADKDRSPDVDRRARSLLNQIDAGR